MDNNNRTEEQYLQMSIDCRNLVQKKNDEIKDLTKMLLTSYGLVRSGLDRDDTAFFEEIRCMLSEWLDELIFDD